MEQEPEKSDRLSAPYLSIDGTVIRNVRETKKLTQLYVASVVGVTTDTISRWENNRYPSIKRDNAEKLASALGVELSEILKEEEAGELPEAAPAPQPVRSASRLFIYGFAGLILVACAVLLFLRRSAQPSSAVRWLPRYAAPGEIIPVQVRVTPPKGSSIGFILKEKLPDGFKVVGSLPHSASMESSGAGIKWLIPEGKGPVTIFYTVQIPLSAPVKREQQISGEIVLHEEEGNRTETVGGSGRLQLGAYHWADANGDGRIDDDEIMPAYYMCEEMKDLGLDWKTIEAIWSGKGYSWDPRSGYNVKK
jgi:transcriptional regulator with XRE-family HTH domain